MKNFFSNLAATALTGLAALGVASSAFATPAQAQLQEGSLEAHAYLAEVIKAHGVSFYVNHDYCQQNPDVMGFYSGRAQLLVVCQDNYKGNGPVEWTANDLDTLRHEAQHMIQDCMIGSNHDHVLKPVYRDPIGNAFSVLGSDRMKHINDVYRANGANTDTVILEWEAFTVAELNIPLDQAGDIQRFCGAN